MAILFLTLRQFIRSRSIYVVAGISLLSILFASIPLFTSPELSRREIREFFASVVYLGLFSGTLLPLATLVISTGALGDEIEDRTLQYLSLKPIGRFQIVLAKFMAVVLVLTPMIWVGLAATWAVCSWGRFDETRDLLFPALLSTLIGILGFGAVFMLISLFVQRALLIGVFYVFVWESVLSRFLPGIRTISIRHYTQSLFVRLVDDRRITIDKPAADVTVIYTIVGIVLVSLILSTWRLRSMSLE